MTRNARGRWFGLVAGVLCCWGAAGGQSSAPARSRPAATRPAEKIRIPPVPKGHPRVYVRPADLPAIRAKLKLPQFARSWKVVRATAARSGGAGAFCSAFIYLVQGDRRHGRKAVERALRTLSGSRNARTFRTPMHWAACVYDWCYDLLTDEEKRLFVAAFERIASGHSPRYPARERCSAVVGHTAENWLLTGQLPAGVAIYDERPLMYDAAARVFFKKFVPARNYHYASHMHHQGTHYATRLLYDLGAVWLFRRMGAGDVFSRELQFVPYEHIYHLRPDGQVIRRGDSTRDTRSGRKWSIMTLAASYFHDGYLLWTREADCWFNHCKTYSEVFDLLVRPANLKARPISELPLTKYFPHPMGEMVARTGWKLGLDSRDAVVHMRIGGAFFGNHQKLDMGTFQIYYRGPLALTTGSYAGGYGTAHWRHYFHQTLSSNGLLIFDPDEEAPAFGKVPTGGQLVPNGRDHPRDLETILTKGYEQGRVWARAFGPDAMRPEYSYIAGDITKSYGPKAALVTRSMVTFNLRDRTYPAMVVVFDRVASTKAEFPKTWLLHSIQEPAIDGRTVTVVCDGKSFDGDGRYGGKLQVRSLLPEAADLRKIGGPGREFWVESVKKNYDLASGSRWSLRPGYVREPGAWRVEVSPAKARKSDRFLHVMTVMDAAVEAGPEIARVRGHKVTGVAALDRAVVFGLEAEPQREVAFQLPPGRARKVLVCDLAPGYWSVARDGKEVRARLPVTREAHSAYFRAGPGRLVLKRIDRTVPAPAPDTFWDNLRVQSLRTARPPK